MNDVLCGGKTYGDDGVLYDVFFSGSNTTFDDCVYDGYVPPGLEEEEEK